MPRLLHSEFKLLTMYLLFFVTFLSLGKVMHRCLENKNYSQQMLIQAVGTILPESLISFQSCRLYGFFVLVKIELLPFYTESLEQLLLFVFKPEALKNIILCSYTFKALACTFKLALAALLCLTVPSQRSLEITMTILWYHEK